MYKPKKFAIRWGDLKKSFVVHAAISFVILALSVTVSHAQVGVETSHWNWTPEATYHDSVVEIETESGSGTGVLVHIYKDRPVADGFEGLCLTAQHVVGDEVESGNIKVIYRNGKRAKHCKVVASNMSSDVALLLVWVPAKVKPVALAKNAASKGSSLEFCGLGGGTPLGSLRHFSSTSDSPTNTGKIYAPVPLLPGDSGGPVFDEQGDVVGIISGGWFWFDGGVKSQLGFAVNVTWPARACNLDPINTLLQEVLNESAPALASK